MIFVTVGTHEQQFDRLVRYMDTWAESHDEKVIMQIGYCTHKPKNAQWYEFLSYYDMKKIVDKARIIITHGGPSSFIMPLQIGKTPIVVPRKLKYNEHVNNHQLDFCKKVNEKGKSIIVIEDINELENVIKEYNTIQYSENSFSNNSLFCTEFTKIINKMF